jgi:hypothetical protein
VRCVVLCRALPCIYACCAMLCCGACQLGALHCTLEWLTTSQQNNVTTDCSIATTPHEQLNKANKVEGSNQSKQRHQ